MARVQLIIPDADHDRFVAQARREGATLSAWLRAAAEDRLAKGQRVKPFESSEDVDEFFQWNDALDGPEREPDWSEHLQVINESRAEGMPDTRSS